MEKSKYELFAEHIINHFGKHNKIPQNGFVICNMCGKTINDIYKEYKQKVDEEKLENQPIQ